MRVSLTSFVDFAAANGAAKLEIARKNKRRRYRPEADYYKQIREKIVDIHRQGQNISSLMQFCVGVTNPKKTGNYLALAKAYQRWFPPARLDWIPFQRRYWLSGELEVVVNPELGLNIDGIPHIIKLYFKADPLTQNRIDYTVHLIERMYGRGPPERVLGILDIRRELLHTGQDSSTCQTLLEGEAAFWMAIYPTV